MKKILLSAVSLAILYGSALAADLPSMKSAPVATPVLSWTGAYAGLNAGGTWGNSNNLNATTWNIYQPAASADYTAAALLSGNQQSSVSSGFIGGGQIGITGKANFLI